MNSEDESNEKMVDNGQKDNLDAIKQDDHQDYGDKGDDHAGMKAPEAPPAPEVPGVLPEHVDIVLAQDTSASFDAADRANLAAPFLANLDAALAAGGATDAAYGITNFVDYPFDNFGFAGDVIYNTDQAVTTDVAATQAALDGLPSGSGNDLPEAQLVALQQIALRAESPEIGFRPDTERFVVLATDAPFHQAGDYAGGGVNNNNTNLADGTGTGGVEDYPSIAQVAGDLAAANVTPIFAVTADQTATYQGLVNQLDAVDPSIDGSVVTLSPDSANLADAILAGLTEATAPDMLLA